MSTDKEEEAEKPSLSPLRIGDLISLVSIRDRSGNLSASGVLDDEIMYDQEPSQFDQCVFQIVLQNQYSASRELMEYVQSLDEKEEAEESSNSKMSPSNTGGAVSPANTPAEDSKAASEAEAEKKEIQKFLKALEHGRDNEEELNR